MSCKVKWAALLLLPAVALITHFLLTGNVNNGNGHLSTTDSIYTRHLGNLHQHISPRGNSEELTGTYEHEETPHDTFYRLPNSNGKRKVEMWKSSGPRLHTFPPRASRKYPYNMGRCWGGVVDDHVPGSAIVKLRENARKLLSEAINCLTCIGASIFSPLFDLFTHSVTFQTLCEPHALERDKPYRPLAPALYIFGDSLSDSGNNNFLQTEAKVNYRPYGIDFPSGATGRFTNGKTFVDFIAQFLGLPFAPPYLGLSANDKINIKTGVNYASGSAGILEETGTALGENLSFNKQIQYFQDTITNDLLKTFKAPARLLKYLSKSIFVISIGNNDYLNNYLQPANYMSSHIYTSQQFANLLINELGRGLRNLYSLGARKFLVFNIGNIGCTPSIVNSVNPKLATPCVEGINEVVLLYNSRLLSMLEELESTLVGSTFVRGDATNATQESSESGFGFSAMQTPCCEVDGGGLCLPDQRPCQDRNAFTFWDAFHPTEQVYNGLANECFSGSFTCTPINVQQLAEKH